MKTRFHDVSLLSAILATLLALSFLPGTAARGASGGGGGGRSSGGSSGGSRSSGSSGTSSSSASSGGRVAGTRTAGRTSSGLRSGGGGVGFIPIVGFVPFGLYGYGAYGYGAAYSRCRATNSTFVSPNGTAWALRGCDAKKVRAVTTALTEVCGAVAFEVSGATNTTQYTTVGDADGVVYATSDPATLQTTDAEFNTCVADNSNASYGLSNGAIAGIVIGSVVGAILVILGIYCICKRSRRTNNTATMQQKWG